MILLVPHLIFFIIKHSTFFGFGCNFTNSSRCIHHSLTLAATFHLSTTVDKSNKSTRNVSDDFSHFLKPHTTNNFAIKINYCLLWCPLIFFSACCIHQLGCIQCSNFWKIYKFKFLKLRIQKLFLIKKNCRI